MGSAVTRAHLPEAFANNNLIARSNAMEPHASESGANVGSGIPLNEYVYNERGVIAENYHDLQGLGVLEAARQTYPLPKASAESTLRTVFQCVDVALLNLADVMARAVADLDRGAFSTATIKMFWARGFHRLLTQLSLVPSQLGFTTSPTQQSGTLRIQDSPAFKEYLTNLDRFDQVVIALIESGMMNAEQAIGEGSLDSWEYNFFHLARVCNHEATIWENNLAGIKIPAPVPSYQEFVVSSVIRDAVYDRVLKGDTYFTQFRGLHQIPESLGEEVNDRLEQAIRAIRQDKLRDAVEELRCIGVLAQVITSAVAPMADSLATSDYHMIRENLGLTSGSHSVCLRFHMFTHLYDQLCDEVVQCAARMKPGNADPEETLREISSGASEDENSWLLNLAGSLCLNFRALIFQWRDEHIHMPRNNLGGDFTKSLTGSKNAIKAVKGMRDAARIRDPFAALVRSRDIRDESAPTSLASYFDSDISLDARLMEITGKATQERFVHVQERLGFFANKCPFAPPPRRKA
jgi:hypothetical protein